jgi:hypothetical protein
MITLYLPNQSRGSIIEIKLEPEPSGFRTVAGVIYFSFLSEARQSYRISFVDIKLSWTTILRSPVSSAEAKKD